MALDDAQGGSGIGIRFRNAAGCAFIETRMEAATFDTFLQFDATSADNRFSGYLASVASTKIVDTGVLNEVYGSDGSGGFVNSFKLPLNLKDVRSLTLGLGGTAITKHLRANFTIGFGTVPAQSHVDSAQTLTGCTTTSKVDVNIAGTSAYPSGLLFVAVPGTNQVTIRAINYTSGAINAAGISLIADAWNH